MLLAAHKSCCYIFETRSCAEICNSSVFSYILFLTYVNLISKLIQATLCRVRSLTIMKHLKIVVTYIPNY